MLSTMIINMIRNLIPFFLIKSLGQFLDISPKHFIFLEPLVQDFHILKFDLVTKFLNA